MEPRTAAAPARRDGPRSYRGSSSVVRAAGLVRWRGAGPSSSRGIHSVML